jgi:hypothetical protein
MALPSWCNETVTRLRAPYASDRYGNEASSRDWASATSLSIANCSVQPMVGSEVLVDRDARVHRWILYGPANIDVLPTDRIVHKGVTYEVQGDVRHWTGATGNLDNTQLELERVDG